MKIGDARVSTGEVTAEKIAILKARGYLAERGTRAVAGDLGRILAKTGTPPLSPVTNCGRADQTAAGLSACAEQAGTD